MEIRVMAVGDVVGRPGLHYLTSRLRTIRKQKGIDFCVVNGENAAMNGMTPGQGEDILDAGADVVTLGNHTWRQREIVDYLDETSRVLRPANFMPQLPGQGMGVYETGKGEIAVVNLIGQYQMDVHCDNPFYKIDDILCQCQGIPVVVDFHAEASSEKLAMGFYLDGRVGAIWGTHCHVPTADLRILPQGTGYISDLGMTGPRDGVLGIRPEQSIALFRGELTSRFAPAAGSCWLTGAIFTLDGHGKCVAVEQVLDIDV